MQMQAYVSSHFTAKKSSLKYYQCKNKLHQNFKSLAPLASLQVVCTTLLQI
jgi:hypothetical protein